MTPSSPSTAFLTWVDNSSVSVAGAEELETVTVSISVTYTDASTKDFPLCAGLSGQFPMALVGPNSTALTEDGLAIVAVAMRCQSDINDSVASVAIHLLGTQQ